MVSGRFRRPVLAGMLVVVSGAGCNLVLGLNEYTDVQGAASGDGGSTASGTGGGNQGGGGTGGGTCAPGTTAPCYGGPSGTDGVGICKAGTKTCNGDGTGYGACEGEVVPQKEDCSKPEDEDCSGLACAEPLWSKSFGDVSNQNIVAITTDKAGNVYVAGNFTGAIDFGGGALAEAGGGDGFVAKLDAAGKYVWARRFGDAEGQKVWDMAVDSAGNVAVVGDCKGTITIDGVSLAVGTTHTAAFAIALDSSGQAVWGRKFNPSNVQTALATARGVAFGSGGAVVVTGFFRGQFDFGKGVLIAGNGTSDNNVFLAKLVGTDGSTTWANKFGGVSGVGSEGHLVATDSSDNIVLQGFYYGGSIDFGDKPLPATGPMNAFLVKLDSQGAHNWSKSFGSMLDYGSSDLAVNAAGEVLLAGKVSPGADIGCGALPASGGGALLARFSAGGACLSNSSYGGAAGAASSAVAVDSSGNVLLVGSFQDIIDFGNGGQLAGAGKHQFLAKLDSSGGHVWSKSFTLGTTLSYRVAAAPMSGNVLVAGSMGAAVDLGTGALSYSGGLDAFVASFAP